MTKLNFEIEIPANGYCPGTLGWVYDILKSAKLKISKTKTFFPCLVIEMGNTKKVIAFISNNPEDIVHHYSPNKARGYCVVFPEEGQEMRPSLFETPLTPSAHEKVDEFLREASNRFFESWENDFKNENEIQVQI